MFDFLLDFSGTKKPVSRAIATDSSIGRSPLFRFFPPQAKTRKRKEKRPCSDPGKFSGESYKVVLFLDYFCVTFGSYPAWFRRLKKFISIRFHQEFLRCFWIVF